MVDAAIGCARKQSRPLHFSPYGIGAVDSVRIKLNSHGVRVQIVQKDFDFKHVVVRVGFDTQVSEAQRAPLPIHGMLPLDYLPADCAFIGSAQTVGASCGNVMLLGIFTHCAARREARCQLRHTFPHPLDPCGGNAALVPGIKLRDHLPFEQVVERVSFNRVPSRLVAMLLTVPQASAHQPSNSE